tara:strand:+ start:39 stop:746 length:708 start_codon:yes stop_codon:yes gene_type:complete
MSEKIDNYLVQLVKYSKKIFSSGLVIRDFGNLSVKVDNKILIKASGRPMEKISKEDFVFVDIDTGKPHSDLNPSSDTPTHLELFKKFKSINSIVHTHSTYATSWAQSGLSIPVLGTTHADYWPVDIPITRELRENEIKNNYEANTGKIIVEKINQLKLKSLDCPGVIVKNHGPFTWGSSIKEAVMHAEILEYVAKMAFFAKTINPNANEIDSQLLSKHFYRKHGPNAYYGQNEND